MAADVLALIPVRGGSKGVPRKNLRTVGGIPLVVRAIRSGLEAARVTQVLVSTDDDEIAAVARAAGAGVLMRPAALAADDTPMMPVLQHALETLEADQGWRPGILCLLDATSPFRTAVHVDACVEKLLVPPTRSVVTVTQLERNPFNIFAVDGDDARRYVRDPSEHFTARSQFSHLKRVNGCVYCTWSDNVRAGALVVDPIKVVEMPAEDSINIDSPLDLAVAELIARSRVEAETTRT